MNALDQSSALCSIRAAMADPTPAPSGNVVPAGRLARKPGAREVLSVQASMELVFAVVGHIGSGCSTIGESLGVLLREEGFDVEIIKARAEIIGWAQREGRTVPKEVDSVGYVSALQDFGDEMRRADSANVAIALLHAIRRTRATKTSTKLAPGQPVPPDERKRAYILDSLRHPAEADLLRQVYRSSFILLGVVCEEDEREHRLVRKFADGGVKNVRQLMERDSDAADKPWGQHVQDTFHTADMFLDNSQPRMLPGDAKPNPGWSVPEQLNRLVKVLRRQEVVRPTVHESAMYAAYGAKMASACLSRQVGAALVDRLGNVVATGTNEVPRAQGGTYAGTLPGAPDHRCAHRDTPFCSNVREQERNIESVIAVLPDSAAWTVERRQEVAQALKKTPLGAALEFSRAVHAEMDAILAAARSGAQLNGARLYVTTFPCHYCARHIVVSGIDEVQYVEPYPKSRALKLHSDSITLSDQSWKPPSDGGDKVLMRPFTGIAPRLYRRAFLESGPLKDARGNLEIGAPPWGESWQIMRVSYAQLEAELAATFEKSGT